MKNTVFIFTNAKQLFGARLARFALEKHRTDPLSFTVKIVEVEKVPAFQKFVGSSYTFGREGSSRTFTMEDLQSFTLTRFMPPELMGFEGRAIGIDPDIFALGDVSELFKLDLQGHAIAACRKKDAWDSSVMVMDAVKLTHWKIDTILKDLAEGRRQYMRVMTLDGENVLEIPRTWNSLDTVNADTRMLHTTERLTQPWKTGLPIDFTRNRMPKFFGVIPREPIHRLLGRYPTRYQPHPDKKVETFFFGLARGALERGVITKEDIAREVAAQNIRPDFAAKVGVV